MFNRTHSNNNYFIHVIYFVLCSAVEPMTTLSWQLCKQACYQVGYGVNYGGVYVFHDFIYLCVVYGVVVECCLCYYVV